MATLMLILMSLIVFFSNQYFAREHRIIVGQMMPLSEAARQLTELTAELIARQHMLVHSEQGHLTVDLPDLQHLEAQFELHWQTLSALILARNMLDFELSALESYFREFLSIDKKLSALQNNQQQLRQQLAIYPPGSQQALHIEQQLTRNKHELSALLSESMRRLDNLRAQMNQFSADINHLAQQSMARPSLISDTVRWIIVLGFVFLVLAMIWFVRLISSRVNQPLAQLREAMRALSTEKFSTRMPVAEGQTEFSLLAYDFNVFAENTENLFLALDQTRQTVQLRERYISAILNGVPEAILTLTPEGVIQDCNPAAENIFNAESEDLIGQNLLHYIQTDSKIRLEDVTDFQTQKYEYEVITFSGETLSVLLSLKLVAESLEAPWVCVISDISHWKQTKNQLQRASNELNAIFENAMVGIAYIKDRRLVRINQKFVDLFGGERNMLEGQLTRPLHLNEDSFNRFGEHAYQVLNEGGNYEGHIEMQRLTGERFWCALSSKAVNPEAPEEGSIWLFEDVTSQRSNEERLTRLASIDSLTGLLNRNVFNDRLEHALHKAQRNQGRLAVFFLDLDHFKHINDSLGHKAGDALLCEVARRIRSCVRESDTVARLGGDEFTVILEDITSAQYVGRIAEKILGSTTLPFMIDNVEINVSPSIGISLYPADGRDSDMLIRNADAAMYHAKMSGRNNFQFYSAEMNAEASHRLALETSLRRAVEQNEFYLQFQPQIDLNTGEIVGAEALLRWTTEQWGDVSPARFVPVLEDTGLIGVVGQWVLRETCRVFMANRSHLPENFIMAVNLSSRQFRGGRLGRFVHDLLEETQMPAANLELEITESLLMDNTDVAIETLRELSELGLTLAVDDFGTGYSSLAYLKQFPLNILKVDRSFVRDVTSDSDDAAIVAAIIAMAESLGLQIVAEGIETADQLAFLKSKGCHRAQGFYFSKALDIDALLRFIASASAYPDFDR